MQKVVISGALPEDCQSLLGIKYSTTEGYEMNHVAVLMHVMSGRLQIPSPNSLPMKPRVLSNNPTLAVARSVARSEALEIHPEYSSLVGV